MLSAPLALPQRGAGHLVGKQTKIPTARGRQVEQPASLVVLATYCFNNTRLLLLSGIGTPYDPAAGRGDLEPDP